MRRTILALSALATTLTAMPAQAEVVEIAPSSPWNIDFGETKCRLARIFGEGDAQHILFFEQYFPSKYAGLTLAGPSYSRFGNRKSTDLAFNAAQESRKTQPFTGKVEGFGDGVIYSAVNVAEGYESNDDDGAAPDLRLPQLDKEAAREVEFVAVKQRGDDVRLMTGPLDQAFAAMDTCALDLIGTWGLDVEQHRTATRMPLWTNREGIVRRIVAAYPRDAQNFGEQGIMRMRVIVNPDGAVEDCVILKATSADRLESPACRAMANAKFDPALDAAGQPMRSYHAESIVYQLGR
ncbi:MAG: TonB family protein [Sphingomonadales bacterium]|nr:TonB family protein [Sphingomonadales bacterium]NCQ19956.1 TonB family protein [Sphingomonadales bacterium]NCT02368.1 TonB family protein [Sphingomonadales bacterium]